jgi:hypothetical protein
MNRFVLGSLVGLLGISTSRLQAYVEAPLSLGSMVQQSTNIVVMQITAIDKEKNLIIYKKLQDLKGKHPQDVIKHNIGKAGLRPNEWKEIMDLAEVGKIAIFCHNVGASETYLGSNWYQAYPRGDWWDMTHAEPFLLRSFSGKPEKLIAAVNDIVAGKEVIVPCMVDGNKEDLHFRRAKVQRLRASLKLADYNPKRDFVSWGGEDIRKLSGMPAFSQLAQLGKVDSEAVSTTSLDFDGDGKTDICLCSTSKVVLLANQGDSFTETMLPGLGIGARSAVWGDYNGDGKPDLLLATIQGPRLYTNLGAGQFKDDSMLLPSESCYNLTCAAWIDADGDGRLDVLLANGFHGQRLYRNKMTAEASAKLAPPKFSDWYTCGPFPGGNFEQAFPPEKEIDYKKQYDGKPNEKASWKQRSFPDGNIHNLQLFRPENNSDAFVYLHREIEVGAPTELPISLGSDDSLTVWLNGEKLLAENIARACATDQNQLKLKLKAGKNQLLLKIGQGSGDWAFYFAAGAPTISAGGWFDNVTNAWGLNDGSMAKGNSLCVADFNGDGKSDFLFASDKPKLFLNQGAKFEVKTDLGLDAATGNASPILADFNRDSKLDLLMISNNGHCRIYLNDGAGRFKETSTGELAKPIPGASSAAVGDFNNDGQLDLFIGCLRGINRYFEGKADGTFTDKTTLIGLNQKLFNTRSLILSDVNQDGRLDLILNNEGQESSLLFSAPDSKAVAVLQVQLPKSTNAIGAKASLLDASGKPVQTVAISGGDARGGQSGLIPRFTGTPGEYTVEVRLTNGQSLTRKVKLDASLQKLSFEEK